MNEKYSNVWKSMIENKTFYIEDRLYHRIFSTLPILSKQLNSTKDCIISDSYPSKSNYVIPHLHTGTWKIDKNKWYFQGSGKDEKENEL